MMWTFVRQDLIINLFDLPLTEALKRSHSVSDNARVSLD